MPIPAFVPNAPWKRNLTATNGSAPSAAMIIPPMRKASRIDSSGTRHAPNAFFSFSILRLLSLAGHGKADFFHRRVLAGEFAHNPTFKADDNAVGHFENFVKVRADEQNANASFARTDHLLMHKARRADIQASRRVRHHKQRRIVLQLPRENDLLLVAAGKRAHALVDRRTAHVVFFGHPPGIVADGALFEKQTVPLTKPRVVRVL